MNEKNGESSRAGERFRARMEVNPTASNEAGPSSNRKVRTVPPHAALEPSEPPSPTRPSNDSTLVNSVDPSGPNTAQRKSRPRPKLRYSTSESSFEDTDDEGSDEDPPWWTFTQRGMHKMKLRNQRLQEAGQRTGTDDSGREEGGHSSSRTTKPPKRRSKRGSDGHTDRPPAKKGSSGHESTKRWTGSRELTPRSSSRNLHGLETPKPPQRPPVLPANMRMSTPAFLKSRKGTETPPVKIKMKRRYSAPSSPVPSVDPMPSIAMVTSPIAVESPDPVGPLQHSLPIGPIQSIRSLSIPRPPFMKRHSESLTDTEAVASSSVRLKAKRASSTVKKQTRSDSQTQPPSGTSTPMRRGKERKQTMSKLKLNLPDQVTQHFAHGWPHAGSWQDALYGYYDEIPKENGGAHNNDDSGKSLTKEVSNRRGSAPRLELDNADTNGVSAQTPGRDGGSDTGSPAPRAQASRRGKPKRRRHRQALAPPTPSGLGFTDAEKGHGIGSEAWKHGQVGDEEFDWGNSWNGNGVGNGNGNANGHGNRHDPNRITEESADLSRSETRITATEKLGTVTKKAGAKIKSKVVPNDGMDWKQRFRRIMFLDARVTIWIRFANLAVVVCSLALAITIREQLFDLRLPGLMGPSTTLVIAYSCLTIIHIFVAVYREYFGRPIGLWGLRSKMLWVCLDLLFVALWSSGLTLQINDLIDTPLDCVQTSAWWEEGRSAEYAALLDDLDVGVTEPLGIILPDVITTSSTARAVCRRQEGGIALALMTLLLYGGNMVLSLFRIFETVRRTAHVDRAVMF